MKVLYVNYRYGEASLNLLEILLTHRYGLGNVDSILTYDLEEEGIPDEIDNLDDGTYDLIYLLDEEFVASDFKAMLIPKLKASVLATITPVSSGTCQANVEVDEIILAAAESQANDYYNDMYIITSGTTAEQRIITDYVGATDTCTIAEVDTAITDTETYKIYSDDLLADVIIDVTELSSPLQDTWTALWPNTNPPLIVEHLIDDPGEPFLNVEGAVYGASDYTLAALGEFEDGKYDGGGWYVIVTGSESGLGTFHEPVEIESNTESELTLSYPLDNIADGEDISISIFDNKDRLIAYEALNAGILFAMGDPFYFKTYRRILQIINNGKDIAQTDIHLDQDLDEYWKFVEENRKVLSAISNFLAGVMF